MEQEQIDKEIFRLVEQKPGITNQELARSLAIPENVVKERLQRLSDTRQKILIVDDELDALTALKRALESDNYNVVEAVDGLSAIKKIKTEKPDIVLLDLMMPEIDGFEVCKRLKSDPLYKHVPIIMLTAKGENNDKIEGIEIGADDYICKPFDVDELVLRINNILRRSSVVIEENTQIGQYEFSFEELVLTGPEDSHKLTMKEGMLLRYFLEHQNKLVKREDILVELWGENDYFLGRSMDVFVSRLRKYLQREKSVAIDTVRGTGYIFRIK